jgi:hypothetical protein
MIGTGAAILGAGVLGAGASMLGASNSAGAARDASRMQADAANRASDTQLAMYGRTRADLFPFMGTGMGAFNSLAQLYGLPTARQRAPDSAGAPGGAPASNYLSSGGGMGGSPLPSWEMVQGTGSPNFAPFMNSPDYQFAVQEGQKALDRTAAARGQLVSGNQLRAAERFGQGLGTQQFGNYFNRLMSMSQLGLNAAAGVGSAGTSAAGQIGQSQMAAGQAGASGIVGAANAFNSGLSGVSNSLTGGVNNLMLMNMLGNRGGSASAYQPAGGGMFEQNLLHMG